MDNNKLFLLDAMALIYRAHFALSKNPRINSRGINTGAAMGFTNSLLEILSKEKPSHIMVAFDTSAPTFRHETYKEYKAQRQEQPEDIQIAIPHVKQIIEGFNIKMLEYDGYEADDLIGTIAKKAARQHFKVYMMTPDKDFSQIVEENIFLYKPAYMGNTVDILGVAEVLKKFDIEKIDQVRDILGLQGDSIDNIPGIPGIGAKTAVKLLKEFGSVENIIKNADQLKGKLRERVIEFGQQGILSKQLATIKTDIEIDFIPDECAVCDYDEVKLRAIFDELEFRALARRVFGEENKTKTVKAASVQLSMFDSDNKMAQEKEEVVEIKEKENIFTIVHDYHLIDTPLLRKSLIDHLSIQEEFCFDTETVSLDTIDAKIVGMAFAYQKGEAYYVPLSNDPARAKEILYEFKPLFEDENIKKIGQNIKYDYMVLATYGIQVKGTLLDTMLIHYLIEPDNSRHGMDVLAESYLNYLPVPIEELIGKKGPKQLSMKDVSVEKLVEYAGEDADVTFQLKQKLEPQLRQYGVENLYHQVEAPLIRVLATMEKEGVKVDTETLSSLSKAMEDESCDIEKEIFGIADCEFNIASPKQLGEILFDKLRLIEKPKKTRTGQYATGEEILSKLAHEHHIAKRILEYREVQKLKNTYVDALPNLISPFDGRIHTSYNQAVAATGRLSSNNPNLQNIPIRTEKGREIRKAFVPRNKDYILMSADYSQVELRIMASFAQDETMIQAFREGKDIHAATAAKIFKVPLEEVDSEMRRRAKTANFGIIYGISAFGLSERLGIPRREAADIISAYFKEFPGVKKYMDRVINQAREQEFVETIMGRRRYLRDINSRNATMRGFAERNAINAPIQGSAADIIKVAMIRIDEWIRQEQLQTRMILQVHDELVFDVYQPELEFIQDKIPELMQNAARLDVPLIVEVGVGQNWLEAH
ncbi:MAG: DNA polymerase I [Candidatus Cyclobacteriaceae bacterium M3_2C_046]